MRSGILVVGRRGLEIVVISLRFACEDGKQGLVEFALDHFLHDVLHDGDPSGAVEQRRRVWSLDPLVPVGRVPRLVVLASQQDNVDLVVALDYRHDDAKKKKKKKNRVGETYRYQCVAAMITLGFQKCWSLSLKNYLFYLKTAHNSESQLL